MSWTRATVDLDVPAGPVPLELANLTHLSTDITGRLDDTGTELRSNWRPGCTPPLRSAGARQRLPGR